MTTSDYRKEFKQLNSKPAKLKKFIKHNAPKERKFGKYCKNFGSHEGSDIDVVVMIPRERIPSYWKYLNTEKDWWFLYRGGKINIKGTIHKVDLIIVKEGKEEYARNRIKSQNWKVERII